MKYPYLVLFGCFANKTKGHLSYLFFGVFISYIADLQKHFMDTCIIIFKQIDNNNF